MDKILKKKIVTVNFICSVFYLLEFFTLEDGTDRLSKNVGEELPFYAA
jgi:ssDNA-specific exonuclease RecJ